MAAAAVGRFALVKRQQFLRCAVAAAAVDASCDIAFAAAASCSEMADVDASFDSAGLGCGEIECLRRYH